MDDKRLLELAAKAAGYKSFEYFETSGDEPGLYVRDDRVGFWRPLSDDGDVFRLAVKLKLSVWLSETCVTVECMDDDGPMAVKILEHYTDDNEASRLAVLEVAAAIGESMENGNG